MDITDKLNMTMLCDFYELTMGNGYLEAGLKDRITYFDIFFRDVPDHGGYAICAGLERIIAYIQDLHFSEEDIEYLRSKDLFSERFLDYLRDFKFTGDVSNLALGLKDSSRIAPVITFLYLVRTKAAPLPGLTCWKSTTSMGLPSISNTTPLRKSPAEIGIVKSSSQIFTRKRP
jgi:hypothetical protein